MYTLQHLAAEAYKNVILGRFRHREETKVNHVSIDHNNVNRIFNVTLTGALYMAFLLIQNYEFMFIEPIDFNMKASALIDNLVPTIKNSLKQFSNNIIDMQPFFYTKPNVLEGIRKVKTLNRQDQLLFELRVLAEEGKTKFAHLHLGTYKRDWHKEYFTNNA